MVQYCCAYNCKNRYRKGVKLAFFGFPFKRPEILKQWEAAVHRDKWKPSRHSKLCEEHFTQDCFQLRPNVDTKLLKPDAVPSLFVFPEHLQKVKRSRKPPKKRALMIENVSPSKVQRIGVDHCYAGQEPQRESSSSPTKVMLRKKVKALSERLRRRELKLKDMTEMIENLKKQQLICTDAEFHLRNEFSGMTLELFQNELSNSKCAKNARRYSERLREFALTLFYYSPRAFEYVKKILCLPHASTIQRWILSVDCSPGFLLDVLFGIKEVAERKPLMRDACIIIDSMAIRKQSLWDPKTKSFTGYVDYGNVAIEGKDTLASEVLVFMINGLTGHWKYPFAYFFVDHVNGNVLAQLIRTALILLSEFGFRIWSITCDGAKSNFQALKNLGCVLEPTANEPSSLKPCFRHPCDPYDVWIIFDPCHMLKLARNALSDLKIFRTPSGIIHWDYIVHLNAIQEKEGLVLANKVTRTNIEWHNKKMNVSLAARTLSSSVADAIDFLRDELKLPEFSESNETTRFIRFIDRVFDLMNSRNPQNKGYKAPLTLKNRLFWENVFRETSAYLFTLMDKDGNLLIKGGRKTFVIGFACTALAFQNIAVELFSREINPFHYLLTYKMSQDHLELFFACIRSRGGWNNNPNTIQVTSAMRKLLLKNNVAPSKVSNCMLFEDSSNDAFEFRSEKRRLSSIDDNPETPDVNDSQLLLYTCAIDRVLLNEYKENILFYIAGYLVRKMLKKLTCHSCISLLLSKNDDNDHSYATLGPQSCSKFLLLKNRGGLVTASLEVFEIVKVCEKICNKLFSQSVRTVDRKVFSNIMQAVLLHAHQNDLLRKLDCGTYGDFSYCSHASQVVKELSSSYLTLRFQTFTKGKNVLLQGKHCGLRQKATKMVLFSHV